jgi:glutathione peroxidase
LYERGLRILAFPCNQFGKQEPGSKEQIRAFLDGFKWIDPAVKSGRKLQKGVRFPVFEKCDVNGRDAHPVYRFLRASLSDVLGSSVKWNFAKFLCDRQGRPVKRFPPPRDPSTLVPDIEKLLADKCLAN